MAARMRATSHDTSFGEVAVRLWAEERRVVCILNIAVYFSVLARSNGGKLALLQACVLAKPLCLAQKSYLLCAAFAPSGNRTKRQSLSTSAWVDCSRMKPPFRHSSKQISFRSGAGWNWMSVFLAGWRQRFLSATRLHRIEKNNLIYLVDLIDIFQCTWQTSTHLFDVSY
jgi:hypothetical protein